MKRTGGHPPGRPIQGLSLPQDCCLGLPSPTSWQTAELLSKPAFALLGRRLKAVLLCFAWAWESVRGIRSHASVGTSLEAAHTGILEAGPLGWASEAESRWPGQSRTPEWAWKVLENVQAPREQCLRTGKHCLTVTFISCRQST